MADPSRMHYQQGNIPTPDPNVQSYSAPILGMSHAGISMGQHQPQPSPVDRSMVMNAPNPNQSSELNVPTPDSQSSQVPTPQPTMPMQQQPTPQMSQQQQPQQPPNQQQANPQAQTREVNTASLCRIGQEIVQEIIVKTTDVFQLLKIIQLPSSSQHNMEEIQLRVQDHLNSINLLFKRLRLIYNKCNEDCAGMEYTLIEQSLIPMKDSNEYNKFDEKKNTEIMKGSLEEYKETSEQVIQKNKHLKEVIDHVRHIIWEINTMLAMRKP